MIASSYEIIQLAKALRNDETKNILLSRAMKQKPKKLSRAISTKRMIVSDSVHRISSKNNLEFVDPGEKHAVNNLNQNNDSIFKVVSDPCGLFNHLRPPYKASQRQAVIQTDGIKMNRTCKSIMDVMEPFKGTPANIKRIKMKDPRRSVQKIVQFSGLHGVFHGAQQSGTLLENKEMSESDVSMASSCDIDDVFGNPNKMSESTNNTNDSNHDDSNEEFADSNNTEYSEIDIPETPITTSENFLTSVNVEGGADTMVREFWDSQSCESIGSCNSQLERDINNKSFNNESWGKLSFVEKMELNISKQKRVRSNGDIECLLSTRTTLTEKRFVGLKTQRYDQTVPSEEEESWGRSNNSSDLEDKQAAENHSDVEVRSRYEELPERCSRRSRRFRRMPSSFVLRRRAEAGYEPSEDSNSSDTTY